MYAALLCLPTLSSGDATVAFSLRKAPKILQSAKLVLQYSLREVH